MKACIGGGAALLAALGIMIFQPFDGALSAQAQLLLGAVVLTLGVWIFRPFKIPFSVGAMLLGCLALSFGLAPGVVFSGFTQSAVWTLIAALYFGFALKKSGLGYRIALTILKLFRPTYVTLALAWAVIGLVLSVLTPSMTVRVAIVMPVAASCCELCRLPPRSKGNSLIMLTAFAMAMIPGGGWLNGSLTGPIVQGAFDTAPELVGTVTFESWLRVCLVPVELASLLTFIGGLVFLRPGQPLPREAADIIRAASAGPVRREEKFTAVILLLSFVMFFTGGLHGIPSAAVCLGATFLLFACGVIKPNEIGTGISWDLIVFVGMALGLGAMCGATGITDWLAGLVVPALSPIAGRPFLFVLVMAVLLFAWRFIDIACFIPTITLIAPMLPAIQSAYGIDPLVFAPMLLMACCAFFMGYQNSWALLGQEVAGERSWTPGHLALYGTVYFAASLIALGVMSAVWARAGMLG